MRDLILAVTIGAVIASAQPATPTLDAPALAARVRAEFEHAWNAYKAHAWGPDELLPVSRKPRDFIVGRLSFD